MFVFLTLAGDDLSMVGAMINGCHELCDELFRGVVDTLLDHKAKRIQIG